MAIDYNTINEAVLRNDFTEFNKLSKTDQKEIQKSWDQAKWLNYMSQEPTISENELFDELDRIIDNSEK